MSQILPIVIIDDDVDDRELLGELTKELRPDHELRFFVNGVDALKYLETTKEQPFIILCDVNMPKMNGLAFLDYVRSEAAWKDIPFVLFTAHSSDKVMADAFDAGANAMLPKPFNMADLKSVLNYLHISPQ